MGQGSFGTIEVLEHFVGGFPGVTVGTTVLPAGPEGVMFSSVQEGTFSEVTDEPGGILQILTDTAAGDNHFFTIGPFRPADGGVVMEARFKVSDITTSALYCGFQETVHASTPVFAAQITTETFAYGGVGGFAGLQFDQNSTTDDWRAVAGDSGVANFSADSDATRAYNPPVNDKWDVIRVEIDPNRDVRMYLAGDTGPSVLKLVKGATDVMTDTSLLYAVLAIEVQTADTDLTLEVDYMYARGYRDWTV